MNLVVAEQSESSTLPAFGWRFWAAGMATAIAAVVLAFGVHGGILVGDYAANAAAYRPLDAQYAQWKPLLAAYLLNSFGLVWFYQRAVGVVAPLVRMVAFGLAVAITFTSYTYLVNFVVLPIKASLVIKQIACDSMVAVALSLLISLFYRKR